MGRRTLRSLAAQVFASHERGHTLQATALLHEAFLRMLGEEGQREDWHGRHHFFAVAAKAMRRVLIDHARRAQALKRDGLKVTLSEDAESSAADYDLVDLGEALEELSKVNERVARVVELRLLGGLDFDEVVEVMDVSRRTVFVDWRAGRAWLRERFDQREQA